MCESSLRAPTLIQWKGHIPEGQVLHTPVTSMDLFPTVLDAIGQKNSNTELDGKSLMPLLLNSSLNSPHDFIFHYFDITRPAAITYGQYKVIFSTLTGENGLLIPPFYPPDIKREFQKPHSVRVKVTPTLNQTM